MTDNDNCLRSFSRKDCFGTTPRTSRLTYVMVVFMRRNFATRALVNWTESLQSRSEDLAARSPRDSQILRRKCAEDASTKRFSGVLLGRSSDSSDSSDSNDYSVASIVVLQANPDTNIVSLILGTSLHKTL